MFNITEYKKRMKKIEIPFVCKCGGVMSRNKNYYFCHYRGQQHQNFIKDNLFHLLEL